MDVSDVTYSVSGGFDVLDLPQSTILKFTIFFSLFFLKDFFADYSPRHPMLLKSAPKEYVLSIAVNALTDFSFVDITVSAAPFAFSLDDVATFLCEHSPTNIEGDII